MSHILVINPNSTQAVTDHVRLTFDAWRATAQGLAIELGATCEAKGLQGPADVVGDRLGAVGVDDQYVRHSFTPF